MNTKPATHYAFCPDCGTLIWGFHIYQNRPVKLGWCHECQKWVDVATTARVIPEHMKVDNRKTVEYLTKLPHHRTTDR